MKDRYNVDLIDVQDALKIILDSTKILDTKEVNLKDSLGLVINENVYSDDDIPSFDNSAMDGYAVIADDTKSASKENPVTLELIEDIPAGYVSKKSLSRGKIASIMTGAVVPRNADAVVMVEYTEKQKNEVRIFREVKKNENVRFAGNDIEKGSLVIQKGMLIRPQEMGVLASLGKSKVRVIRQPKIAVIATGDELLEVDEKLEDGKIRNSNTYLLISLIKKNDALPINLGIARDDKKDIENKLKKALDADIILINAGVSVGEYDYVKEVLQGMGVEIKFWRVAIKPGKPLVFGRLGDKLFFGLPGNPVSSMISFDRFVRPSILKMMGKKKLDKREVLAMAEHDIKKKIGKIHYMRAFVYKKDNENYVRIHHKQSSGVLTSMISANCLAIVPKEVSLVKKGSIVKCELFDDIEEII